MPFTPPFNTSGLPAIGLPLAWTAEGLPVGVRLVAGYGREDVLIRVASRLEQAKPWARSEAGASETKRVRAGDSNPHALSSNGT